MPASKSKQLNYGPAKYAAFHLLLCRWLRQHVQPGQFHYITLGGTEMRDIQSLFYIDQQCTSSIVSFELHRAEHLLALATQERLNAVGLQIEVRRSDLFAFQRNGDEPYLFFLDVKGCFVMSQYDEKLAELLLDNRLRPGDSLLITSHLGARRGWGNLLAEYSDELNTLQVTGLQNRKNCFRRSHPSFTLFRALDRIGYQNDVAIRCFGCIEYRDKTPMSIFGYTVAEGMTSFTELVQNAPYFHVRRGLAT